MRAGGPINDLAMNDRGIMVPWCMSIFPRSVDAIPAHCPVWNTPRPLPGSPKVGTSAPLRANLALCRGDGPVVSVASWGTPGNVG